MIDFESSYLKVREKEGRIYDLKTLKKLPEINANHPLYREWEIRKHSANRLVSYLKTHVNESSTIFELGCGNGWLCNFLYQNLNCKVIGIDINKKELAFARDAFSSGEIIFLYQDIFSNDIETQSYDIIVMAAVVQYFPDFPKLINRLKELIKIQGEIHILDSPFYGNLSLAQEAKMRTAIYYQEQSVPELIPFYHHHLTKEIKKNGGEILYNGNSTINRLRRKLGSVGSPFPWIRFKNY